MERYQILDQLALLVDKSLVVAENSGGRTRYRLLETVRQYAQEKLGESGEAEAVRARHRDHYTAMAALLDAPARTDYQQRVEQADEEMDNLRSAFGWSIESGDIASALELACSLQPLWLSRGRIQEGLAWFNAAMTGDTRQSRRYGTCRACACHRRQGRARCLGRTTTDSATPRKPWRSRVNSTIQRCWPEHLPPVAAPLYTTPTSRRRYFDEAIGLARALGDQWRLSQILGQQAQAALVAGDVRALQAAAVEGRDVADAIGDSFGSRQCRWRLASAHVFEGDLPESIAEFRAVIAESETDHDTISRVAALLTMPHALVAAGDTEPREPPPRQASRPAPNSVTSSTVAATSG